MSPLSYMYTQPTEINRIILFNTVNNDQRTELCLPRKSCWVRKAFTQKRMQAPQIFKEFIPINLYYHETFKPVMLARGHVECSRSWPLQGGNRAWGKRIRFPGETSVERVQIQLTPSDKWTVITDPWNLCLEFQVYTNVIIR